MASAPAIKSTYPGEARRGVGGTEEKFKLGHGLFQKRGSIVLK